MTLTIVGFIGLMIFTFLLEWIYAKWILSSEGSTTCLSMKVT